MLALGGGVCATCVPAWPDCRSRAGRSVKRSTPPQPESARTAHSNEAGSPKPAACSPVVPSRTPRHVSYSYLTRRLIPTKHFNLPHPEHLDSRAAPRLDPATDPNPSILQ